MEIRPGVFSLCLSYGLNQQEVSMEKKTCYGLQIYAQYFSSSTISQFLSAGGKDTREKNIDGRVTNLKFKDL